MTADEILAGIEQRLPEIEAERHRLEAARAHLLGTAGDASPAVVAKAPARTRGRKRAPNRRTAVAVLDALDTDDARTAADVARITGISRPIASSTLTRLAKEGSALKASRGYLRAA